MIYFRQFVEKKYGSIAALNREWRSDYASFAEVPHPTMKVPSRATSRRFDHRQYMEKCMLTSITLRRLKSRSMTREPELR